HVLSVFFFSMTPTTPDLSTLSLHDALPISAAFERFFAECFSRPGDDIVRHGGVDLTGQFDEPGFFAELTRFPGQIKRVDGNAMSDRKSTRLNSSHVKISYAVFCLKKKNIKK